MDGGDMDGGGTQQQSQHLWGGSRRTVNSSPASATK